MDLAILSPVLSQIQFKEKVSLHFYGEWATNLDKQGEYSFVDKCNILDVKDFEVVSKEIEEIIYNVSEYLVYLHPSTSISYWYFQLSNVIEQIYAVCDDQISYFNAAVQHNHTPLALNLTEIDYFNNIPNYKLSFAKDFRLHAYASSLIVEFYAGLTNQKHKPFDYSLDKCILSAGLTNQKSEEVFRPEKKRIRIIKFLLLTLKNLYLSLQVELTNPLSKFILYFSKITFLGTNYLDKKTFLQLAVKSRIWPFRIQASDFSKSYLAYLETCNKVPVGGIRDNLYAFLKSRLHTKSSHVSVTTIYLIKNLLPRIFLEDYTHACNYIQKHLTNRSTVFVYSWNLIGGSTLTNLFIQESRRKCGSKLVLTSHGGCFSQMKYSFDEMNWLKSSDYYITWNKYFFLNHQHKYNISFLPSLRFYNFYLRSNCSNSSSRLIQNIPSIPKILYLPTGYYPIRYQYNSSFPYTISSNWETMQCRFLELLHLDRVHLTFRDYHSSKSRTSDFFTYKRLYKTISRLQLLPNINGSLPDVLCKTDLCIHTVFMTTFAEALHQNIASILVTDRDSYRLLPKMKHIEQMMQDVGILHFDARQAAQFVNNIIHDVDNWWSSKEVEKVKSILKDEIYFCNSSLVQAWSDFFGNINH